MTVYNVAVIRYGFKFCTDPKTHRLGIYDKLVQFV